jgi:phage terminase small subunit
MEPPFNLIGDHAREHFRAMFGELKDNSPATLAALTLLCTTWQALAFARAEMDAAGSVTVNTKQAVVILPALNAFTRLVPLYVSLSRRLGLLPHGNAGSPDAGEPDLLDFARN